ncbi:5919_t:CDS:2 [Entrophospora sp. SA101]|nr:5919_t:CDS:2 [Entrophospora sp. SA101]
MVIRSYKGSCYVVDNEVPVHSELAAKLVPILALSTAEERNWSHFGFVHRPTDGKVLTGLKNPLYRDLISKSIIEFTN